MTPQHRLAVEIMSECGMSPHEIVSSFGCEGQEVSLFEVEEAAGYHSQSKKIRSNRFLTMDGKTLTVIEWARITGLNPDVIFKRLKKGLSVRLALTMPLRVTKRTRVYA